MFSLGINLGVPLGISFGCVVMQYDSFKIPLTEVLAQAYAYALAKEAESRLAWDRYMKLKEQAAEALEKSALEGKG